MQRGRRAVSARSWREAHDALLASHRAEPLAADDLWLLAMASYLVGEEEDFVDALRVAHRAFLDGDDVLEAVRTAFWMGQHLASRGDFAQASGWFGRAARVVEEREAEGAALGYVVFPEGYRQFAQGDYEACVRASARAAEIGLRCRDDDLSALALHLQGRALLRLARPAEGLALLDEAMVAVAGDELSPVATGLIYCSVISACREVHALPRAREWTTALSDWCEGQPEMVAYTGPCRVSRAEILRRRGEWAHAEEEARRAQERFERGSGPGTVGAALYQRGEIHRLRGEHAAAEEAFGAAARAGREPEPGLALLRLAQGDATAAAALLRRALAEAQGALARARLLPAQVEILVELGDLAGAGRACDELEAIAEAWPEGMLQALAADARGATLLASGEPREALPPLRRACRAWDALEAPYEGARTRMLIAQACRDLGDPEGAAMEAAAARVTFERLGAPRALGRAEAGRTAGAEHGLTPREGEVLRWLASGRTNRAIGKALSISEKTVARHVANIYGKLGVTSRAAATAYAYRHELAHPRPPPPA